jgi:TRIAP1/MDM35 family protein
MGLWSKLQTDQGERRSSSDHGSCLRSLTRSPKPFFRRVAYPTCRFAQQGLATCCSISPSAVACCLSPPFAQLVSDIASCITMASSLSGECTPLKTKYDTCFNSWFEGYLEPAVAASTGAPEQRTAYAKQKAEEYERSCGQLFKQYQACLQVSTVQDRPVRAIQPDLQQKSMKDRGLEDMLNEARQENPLKTSPPPGNS